MSRRLYAIVLLMALAAVFIAACGGGAAKPQPVSITVVATDIKFDASEWKVKTGVEVSLTLKNEGALEHSWVVKLPSGDKMVHVKAGETNTLKFTAPAEGTYDVICDVLGHKEAGMVGKLIVEK